MFKWVPTGPITPKQIQLGLPQAQSSKRINGPILHQQIRPSGQSSCFLLVGLC